VFTGDEPEVLTYISNVQAVGGTVSATNRALLNRLISEGKSDGWLSTIQRWYFPSGSDSAEALRVPLIDTLGIGNFTNNGFTPTHWTPAGLKGTGSEYIGSGYVPSARIVDPNSFSITAETTEWVVSASYPCLWGVTEGAKRLTFFASSAPDCGSELYDQSTTSLYFSTALGTGTICANRVSSTSHALIFNGSVLGTATALRTGTPPAIEMYFHARNDGGTPDNYSSSRILSIAIATGQTSGQRLAFSAAMSAYKAAKGI
jgi:hypothetical protein